MLGSLLILLYLLQQHPHWHYQKGEAVRIVPRHPESPIRFNVIVIGQNSVDEGGCHFPGQMAGIMKLFCGFSQRLNL